MVDSQITTDRPAQFVYALCECLQAQVVLRIVRAGGQENTDAPHAVRLLRPRRERVRSRTTKQAHELAPLQLSELHRLLLARSDSIADWRTSSQGLAAV